MSKYTEEARRLRGIEGVHHNCCQTVVMSFCGDVGLDPQLAFRLCSNYGGGMKLGGATCGAVMGGLAVLGLFGLDDRETVMEYYDIFRSRHGGLLHCDALLARNSNGENLPKHEHCDGLIYEVVEIAEEMLRRAGKLQE